MAKVTMYVRQGCPFCHRAQDLLRRKGQAWDEIDIGVEPERRDEMIERSGRTTVPQIWIDDFHVGGYDDLAALERTRELDPLL